MQLSVALLSIVQHLSIFMLKVVCVEEEFKKHYSKSVENTVIQEQLMIASWAKSSAQVFCICFEKLF